MALKIQFMRKNIFQKCLGNSYIIRNLFSHLKTISPRRNFIPYHPSEKESEFGISDFVYGCDVINTSVERLSKYRFKLA